MCTEAESLEAKCPSCYPTNSVKALISTTENQALTLSFLNPPNNT